jgi:addiction module HigA family antidote
MFRTPLHRAPSHPGEILSKDFLEPMNLSQSELANRLGIPFQRVNQIVRGRRSVTPDTALRLSKLFGTSVDLWLNLQLACDVYDASHSPNARDIEKIERIDTGKLAAAGGR